MSGSLLRNIRIIVSIIFIIPTTFLFADIFGFIPPFISEKILFLQFVPSILKFITAISFAATGFVIVLLLTLMFGRVYCSSICPLGFFQDVVNWLSKKIKRKKKFRFEFLSEQKSLRIVLLIVPILFFVFGSITLINFLDPYSIYGKFTGNFFRPVLVGTNNLAAVILKSFKIYSVYPYDLKAFNIYPFIITVTSFVVVVFLSWKAGRLYCNTICPVGTLLGYISKFSFFKIVIKQEECLSCGICSKECKASCIDSENKKVDMSRCVACFDCLTSCPTDGIVYDFSLRKQQSNNLIIEQSKRDFILKSSLFLLSLSTIAAQVKKKIVVTKPSMIPIFRKSAVSPPGSISVERFNSKCTACHLCVSACPTQVLQPSFLEYGFTGMMQPRMDNIASFCNFECKICGDVCPTGAILPMDLEKKKLTQIGKAKFVKDNCIVQTQKTDCGACSEHCPTKAVHMIPFEGKLFIPETRDDYCIGCGACEFACPTKPHKAIYVEGNSIHQLAKKNVEVKKEEKVNYK
ncbi:MAG: 4Fe-4S dicluster domain-containing protein, partial [Melioribacter sp.]|nr:4Fe-4S dicluster domain-containing protein [Melioribacter sp.]